MKKAKHFILSLLLALTIALGAVACAPSEPEETAPLEPVVTDPVVTDAPTPGTTVPATEAPTEPASPDSFIFTDSAGREVQIPTTIDRIVPTGPLSQQFLLSIGGDKLVALNSSLNKSEAHYIGSHYQELPEIGQFFGSEDMNMEQLAALEPQVVIDIGEPKDNIGADMDAITEQTGIPAIFIEADLHNAGDAYRTLGSLLGKEELGERLGEYCDDVYTGVTETMSEIAEDERPTFAYLLGETGLNALAKDTYHSTIMDMLGTNVVDVDNPSSRGAGDEINMEQLILWDPEYIFFASGSVYDDAATDPSFSTLTAIKNGKYFEVPGQPYNWLGAPPSVNRYMGLQWMAHILYPDIFTENIESITTEYYELFYDYELSSEEYAEMMANSVLVNVP